MTTQIKQYRTLGILFILYFIISMACYFILAANFNFPDVLRMSAEYRFSLFSENQAVIIPTYYFFAVTGILQVLMAVLFFASAGKKDGLDLSALVMGILSGVFQFVGFIRWVVLIPILSSAYTNGEAAPEVIFFLEKAANGYLGMTLGEHAGNLFLAIWIALISIRLLSVSFAHKSFGIMGLAISVLFFLFAFEPVHAVFTPLGALTVPAFVSVYVWMTFLAISLFISKEGKNTPRLHWAVYLGGVIFWLGNMVPALL